MIVITGSTGQLGRLVIAALMKKIPASGIVASARNSHGVLFVKALRYFYKPFAFEHEQFLNFAS